ncbi:hypothetical protein [Actinacidiphila paucisporea]|uniref:Uncharacterized protein n=1 Tax=Actinacidiphila paucisporea TaxID=310782 RepID=A0A1M7PW37_9ACTN|nr:hypothetical protein [Actinacidiphila paucisporea]SHN21824.1 hypothetical protein SAMN05216499_12667 [Actinacidiphila paucisporea]
MAITDAPRIRDSKDTTHCETARTGAHYETARTGAHYETARTGADCAGEKAGFRPVPVWFFAFEGLMGASYDVVRSSPYGWVFIAASVAVNIVLARTVLRGRLKMAKALLKGKRTRKIAVGLIALRAGLHVVLGAAGMQVTSGPAHIALAGAMCAVTVALLSFEQRVMLRALAAA